MAIKDVKKNYVVDHAAKLFLEKNISAVTIKDIAAAAGVGEATVYRYFSNKSALVVASAVKLQGTTESIFEKKRKGGSGYEKIARFYYVYYDIFVKHPEYYRFLSDFDAFCISGGAAHLEEYGENMDHFRDFFLKAYSEGVEDESINPVENILCFYYATTHALLSLCKKLSGKGILRQDENADKPKEVKALCDVILYRLKNG